MAEQLDVRGEICPYPMMRTVSALKQLEGEVDVLEVVTDHAPALGLLAVTTLLSHQWTEASHHLDRLAALGLILNTNFASLLP